MDGVGARLRDARRQRGLDLAEVEAATKIQSRFLVAIENEEWDALPGEFYARSFIRSYAGYLGLAEAKMADGLRLAGASEAADGTPRIDPAPPQRARFGQRRRKSRVLAALAAVALGTTLVAVGLWSLGDDPAGPAPARQPPDGESAPQAISGQPPQAGGASLSLTATAEVWVCLLDQRGQALIDGQILGAGSEAGPYRSGGFTVSLGNGAVTMSVEGRDAPIPPTPNPIGFAIDHEGAMRQLTESERPDCA